MGSDRFEDCVKALWAELGLPGGRVRPDGTATLTVEGRTVALSPSPDEAGVLVTAAVGRLSDDAYRARDQMRRLLRDGCGLILGRQAALRVRPDGAATVAEVQALAPCRAGAVRAVVAAIEDALFLAEVHHSTLAEDPRRAAAPALRPSEFEDSLIFRL